MANTLEYGDLKGDPISGEGTVVSLKSLADEFDKTDRISMLDLLNGYLLDGSGGIGGDFYRGEDIEETRRSNLRRDYPSGVFGNPDHSSYGASFH